VGRGCVILRWRTWPTVNAKIRHEIQYYHLAPVLYMLPPEELTAQLFLVPSQWTGQPSASLKQPHYSAGPMLITRHARTQVFGSKGTDATRWQTSYTASSYVHVSYDGSAKRQHYYRGCSMKAAGMYRGTRWAKVLSNVQGDGRETRGQRETQKRSPGS